MPNTPVEMLEIAPGAIHLVQYLSIDEQRDVAARCLELGAGDAGFYRPIVRVDTR